MWREKVFTYGIISLLFFSVFASGSVDLWAQTFIHLGTVFLFLLYFFVSFKKKEIVFIPIPPSLVILLFSLILSYFFSYSKFTSRQEVFNWINYFVFFFFVLIFFKQKVYFLKGVIFTSLFLVILQIYQFLFQGIRNPTATLTNPNILAGYLIMAIPLTFKQITNYKLPIVKLGNYPHLNPPPWRGRGGWGGIGYLASGIFLVVGLVLTGSVGAVLSLLIALGWYFKRKVKVFSVLIFRQRRTPTPMKSGQVFYFGAILILIVTFLFIFKLSQPEVTNRFFWWQGTIRMFQERPLTGIGPGNFARYYPQYCTFGLNSLYAHNHYLQILGEKGLFFFLAFFALIISFFQRREKDLAISTGLLAILIHNLIDYNLSVPGVALTFWILLGLGSQKEMRTVHLRPGHVFLLSAPAVIFLFYSGCYLTKIFIANRHYARGVYNSKETRNLALAEKELSLSLKLDTLYLPTYEVLASVYTEYFFQDKSPFWLNQALNLINQAAGKEEKYAPYWLDKAWLHFLLGEEKSASDSLARAKKLNIPDSSTTNLEKLLGRGQR